MIELCCRDGSMIQKACETSEMKYCGVTKDVQMKGVVLQVKRFIAEQRKAGFWVHMHVSTPCTSGSPLRNLSGSASQDNPEWKLIMDSIPQYLEGDSLADSVSFELPRSNSIWERPETKLVLQKGKFDHAQDVHLCQAGYVGKDGLPIGKSSALVCVAGLEGACAIVTLPWTKSRGQTLASIINGLHVPFSMALRHVGRRSKVVIDLN